MHNFTIPIAQKLNIKTAQVETVIALLVEGATIPFIARYRKDATGGLDEVQIQQIQDEGKSLKELTERKEAIIRSIAEQGKLTDELLAKINAAVTLAGLEDMYLPYKQKRKTKAQTARENGLEPLALMLLQQKNIDIAGEANQFLNEKITTADEALQGARDIIAEWINENEQVRTKMRTFFEKEASVQTKVISGKESEAVKFKDYFEFSEPVYKIPSHRMLAVLRGFVEGFLRFSIAPNEEQALEIIEEQFINGMSNCNEHIRKAVKDAYKRLLQPGLETEFRTMLKAKADEEAINVFSENLRQLLLSAPLGSKRILAIDPGYRTGCKVVCLDEKGDLKKTDLIFIHEVNRMDEAVRKIKELVDKYQVEAFAIGDGTAGRETEQFIKKLQLGLPVFLVNEDGASVYSASENAREEFPDHDITVRGSVSIGRRLMDPLAELVKIDPKSIGVGQYQHDVNQFRLKEKLDQTVVSCVNIVGVNLNTASKHLLAYVSGIGETIADNIVKHRTTIGKFTNRQQLLKVPRLGDKAFEQCAGFLRIQGEENILDGSAVHPEAYPVAETIAKDLGVSLHQLVGKEELLRNIDAKKYATVNVGTLAVQDIVNELKKPGLDPRADVQQFEFANIYSMNDLQVGMDVPGMVTNITRFGAFIDIGVKQDGLVHVSEIAHKYISDPNEVLKLNQQVMVRVLEIDVLRKRIALSIRQTQEKPAATSRQPMIVKHSNTNHHHQHPAKKPVADIPMDDALTMLKKKFGNK